MSREPGLPLPLHEGIDVALARLVAHYRVTVDEDRDRVRLLDPAPAPELVRVFRLVPDGTEGESLTVVLTAAGGARVHVRRSLMLELAGGAQDLEQRLVAIADGLGWSRRG